MPPEPKKSAHLQEVEADATRITQKRFDDYFAEQEYQKSKNNPVEEAEVVEDKKGNKK